MSVIVDMAEGKWSRTIHPSIAAGTTGFEAQADHRIRLPSKPLCDKAIIQFRLLVVEKGKDDARAASADLHPIEETDCVSLVAGLICDAT